MDYVGTLIINYKNAKEQLITEREVINGKLTAVGEFISDLEMLREKIESDKKP